MINDSCRLCSCSYYVAIAGILVAEAFRNAHVIVYIMRLISKPAQKKQE
jgi:hypothetical protein